uniref:Uncharacterized protein n=1 Tax=Anguilla anguilla TaxID=7936 RepID=A0A0E9UFV3_ANGAN
MASDTKKMAEWKEALTAEAVCTIPDFSIHSKGGLLRMPLDRVERVAVGFHGRNELLFTVCVDGENLVEPS